MQNCSTASHGVAVEARGKRMPILHGSSHFGSSDQSRFSDPARRSHTQVPNFFCHVRSNGRGVCKKAQGGEGYDDHMARLIHAAVSESDAKWQTRINEGDVTWDARAKQLVHEWAQVTDEKIKQAVEASEKKQEETMKLLRNEMLMEIKKVTPTAGAAWGSDISKQAIQASEKKQEDAVKKLREEMSAIKAEVKEANSAIGTAGESSTSNKTGGASQMNHAIGSTGELTGKKFR